MLTLFKASLFLDSTSSTKRQVHKNRKHGITRVLPRLHEEQIWHHYLLIAKAIGGIALRHYCVLHPSGRYSWNDRHD